MIPYSIVEQKACVDVSYAFYDLVWLPVGHPNKQKRNQVRVSRCL